MVMEVQEGGWEDWEGRGAHSTPTALLREIIL